MYVIIDKTTQAVLHMSNSWPGEDRKPEDLLPGFDPATMVFGRAPEQYLPMRFVIEGGVVRDLDAPPPPAAAAKEDLAQLRAKAVERINAQALAMRAQLVPDYQLVNAGLGLYAGPRVASYRATVEAFRNEVVRLEAAIAKARSAKEIDALQPNFPTALVDPAAAAQS